MLEFVTGEFEDRACSDVVTPVVARDDSGWLSEGSWIYAINGYEGDDWKLTFYGKSMAESPSGEILIFCEFLNEL